ncbi:hypothetical protein SERLA73DRAFT_168569 [Serpula lacrymans var. lacrymans S7.3]|uniref:AP complex subunit beta n=2 Tax=Serpula lacrymans var. lacrymans TaxID=341189 RepID=F8PYN2_SERL3|nr:uncharacterized protein SERLADRAFT_356160 [Serpula lacrymans var. lacrymans S7.9]EGN98995.1 hypothetical protein SERLA73DRAFT_168569 [Serpula lacrymans var. lacrymans S7.3]EGO24580.1 hypothetical protein SERLADRAFT_356160 [Serpula lacrymans var. lacrymans S7.9]
MASININSLAENASRLGMRIQETFSEHTRDLSITRGSGSLFDMPDEKVKNIGRQLDSSSDREKLDAMKRLIALISKGRNVSSYFPQVVKNVASQNLEIRKLVYIYLLRYAEHEPDLALLSINTFQKDLTDSSPLIRAMALRVLSGIKVPMIGSIVVLAIKKCAADISPYVRKAAALAIPKCHQLDEGHQTSLIDIISTLLRDRSPLSIGSAVVAFEAVCPTRLDLLHQQYRRLCRLMVDVDEWGQISLLNLLIRYARVMLPKPVLSHDGEMVEEADSDLQLLLISAEPLFQSKNPAVVLAVVRVFFYIAPPSQHSRFTNPLLRILSNSRAVERVALSYLVVITCAHPHLFSSHYLRLLVRADDPQQVRRDKIRVLLNILNADNYQIILREFTTYAEDMDDEVVGNAIAAIGHCARLIPDCVPQCLAILMDMIRSKQDIIVSNAVQILKSLVQNQLLSGTVVANVTHSPLSIISSLAGKIDDVRHPQAKACVIWLVGQYCVTQESGTFFEGIADWAPDVLRKSARSFSSESNIVKLQILTLSAKLLVMCPTDRTLGLLCHYVFSVARFDIDYDVRDRTRMLASLLAGLSPSISGDEDTQDQGGVVLRREQVKRVLFEGKEDVSVNEVIPGEIHSLIGSLSLTVGKDVGSNTVLPEWLESGIDPTLRVNEDDPVLTPSVTTARSQYPIVSANTAPIVLTPNQSTSPPGNGSKVPWKDLDKFYEDESSEETEESESNSDGEHSNESEEDSHEDNTDDSVTDEDGSSIPNDGREEDQEGVQENTV